MSRVHVRNLLFLMLTILLSAGAIFGQTSGFNYQGRLTDGGSPANGNYDLQFALFDAADGNNQIGQTKTVSAVAVSGGVFTVTLDFGASAFSGANRFLEISARPSGAAAFILLTPRQPISPTPYSLRSLNSGTADNAQQLGGTDAGQYVKTNDARLSDARDPRAGNPGYVQNSINQQAATNFNISGNGTAGGTLSSNVVNAAFQYNLAGQKILSLSSDTTLSLGNGGNVGIGIVSNSKLAVAGTVESTAGGFKFPDTTVQTTAAASGKVYTNRPTSEIEIGFANETTINSLNLPAGTYLVTATVSFQNRANDIFANNTRMVICQLANDLNVYNHLGAKNDPMDRLTVTFHAVRVQNSTGPVSLTCHAIEGGQVFATARRLTAVRVGDSPETQP